MRLLIAIAAALLLLAPASAQTPPNLFTSDEFDGQILGGHWQFINPRNDAGIEIDGSAARITVPGGIDHDAWGGANNAPRLMQPLANNDVELEARFNSVPVGTNVIQGIIVEQEGGTFLRFDFYSNEFGIYLFAAGFTNWNPQIYINQLIASTTDAPLRLRVTRTGAYWTVSYALAEGNWQQSTPFEYQLTVQTGGVFAGNAAGSPAFTGIVDYVIDTSAPVPIPTPSPTATVEPVASPTAIITAIPTVALDFTVMGDEAESVLGDVFASGEEDNPLQYLALSFGGLVVGFFVLAFIADLVWRSRD
jgi:hypothetical protein